MKYLNLLIFLSLGAIFFLFSSQVKFSTNFLELFFSQKTVNLLSVTSKLEISNNIFVAKKGFDDNSLDELYIIADELKKIPEISSVHISLLPSDNMKEYYKQNYYLLADFNATKLSSIDISNILHVEYERLANSFIYVPLDENDPLGLFKMDFKLADKYLILKDYGYVLKAKTDIDTSSAQDAKVLYDKINLALEKHKDTLAYASFFFLVENSAYIKNDTQMIITVASILLLILYFFMLKNYRLLANTVMAIASSIIIAILLSSLLFDEINLLVLAFGISITTISIDYMFHYYFHGDFSAKGFIKQRRVFFGFATTFGVFVIFSFISIKLFSALAFFSAVSLLCAYLIFSFAFSYLDIKKPTINSKDTQIKSFNPLHVVIVSLIFLGYSYANLEFDDNLRNLDYDNVKLLELSKKFSEGLEQNKYQNILLSAKSKELLLQKYEELKLHHPSMLGAGSYMLSDKKCDEKLRVLNEYDFLHVRKMIEIESKKIGFKDVFQNTYESVQNQKCNMHLIDDMSFKIIKHNESYYTMAFIQKGEKVELGNGVEILDVLKSLSSDMQESKKIITKFMIISLIFIIVMLFIVSGLDILYPLAFVLFPLSVVLFFISIFGTINIMHLFALIILIAISIDYGVYMHNTKTLTQTKMAIKYALLSTLAGFGVLIFSDTVALGSIGFVITIGVGAIFILLYGRKI